MGRPPKKPLLNQTLPEPTAFKIEEILFPEQLAFVKDEESFKCAVTSRRAGKTVSCAVDLIDTAVKFPSTVSLYITLSRNNAKKLIWPEIKRLCRKYGLDVKFNESDLSTEFANGSMIYCSGAKDKSEIENFRGLAIKKVYIDECQSFPSYIKELVDDVLAPALIDYNGSLSLIGTPGPIPAGFFYDCSKSKTWSNHKWNFKHNPHLLTKSGLSHTLILNKEVRRRGVTKDDPSIQREFFGKWAQDDDALVFKYSQKINDYDAIPTDLNNFILGVDLGYDDADALAVLGWRDKGKETFLVEEKVTKHQGITELVQQIEEMRKKYNISKIVMDTAGLGKKISEEITRRHQLTILPAEKVRKLEYIELFNDAMRTGRFKAKKNSRFAEDCLLVEWDKDRSTPDRLRIKDDPHSDICDAVLYAWRESYSYTFNAADWKTKPKYGTKEYWQAERDRMEEEAEEFFKAQAESSDPFDDGSGFDWGY